jgi:DNA-binding beta-propeller fold protein YncE
MGIGIDSTDTWGRTFVADRSSDRVTVVYGRSPELTIQCQLPVGQTPYGVAVDAETGHVLVTLRGEPRLAVVDGRTDAPTVLGYVELETTPAWVAIDPVTRRAFVSLFDADQVAVLEPMGEAPYYEQIATIESGPFPRWLAVDPDTGRLLVSNEASPHLRAATWATARSIFDARAAPDPREPIPASVPSGRLHSWRQCLVVENSTDQPGR